MLQPRSPAGRRRDDLQLRMHILRAVRGRRAPRRLSELRRRFRAAADSACASAGEISAFDRTRVEAGRLRRGGVNPRVRSLRATTATERGVRGSPRLRVSALLR